MDRIIECDHVWIELKNGKALCAMCDEVDND